MGRSSHQEVFYEKGVLRSSTKFAGKHMVQNLFFNEDAGTFSYRTPLVVAFVKSYFLGICFLKLLFYKQNSVSSYI